jgi:dolichyl-phosphate-mannose-protein mannosyltransferase
LSPAIANNTLSFGGFASKYIKGKFFMDVHPPLAKMLIALTGWLAGFDGSFDFKEIGKDYLEPGVPYVAMRLFPAICGILVVPCMYFTLKAVGCRTATAAMGAGLVIFGTYAPVPSFPPLRLILVAQRTVSSLRLV